MTISPTKIFIVDDHPLVISGIESMLSDCHDKVISGVAVDGAEAWRNITILNGQLDILIVDIEMDGMDGFELCRRVKNEYPNIKILFLSMHEEVYYVKKAIECEADGYMLKICDKYEFIRGLNALIENGCYFACKILPLIKQMKHLGENASNQKLTDRENEVLCLILQEKTSKEIAEQLFISKQTVDTHRLNIMRKTESKSVVGLLKYAIRNNFIK